MHNKIENTFDFIERFPFSLWQSKADVERMYDEIFGEGIRPSTGTIDFIGPPKPANVIKVTKTMMSTAKVIAKGNKIREVGGLVSKYGGRAKDWTKMKAWDDLGREVHWYYNKAVGIVKTKFK